MSGSGSSVTWLTRWPSPDGKVKNTATIGWVKQVFRWCIECHSPHAIAIKLNDAEVPALYTGTWTGVVLAAILRNPIYVLGVPVYNKSASGRFSEWDDGKLQQVPRESGRSKSGRKRATSDHMMAPENLENAIIDKATWDSVQTRLKANAKDPATYRPPQRRDVPCQQRFQREPLLRFRASHPRAPGRTFFRHKSPGHIVSRVERWRGSLGQTHLLPALSSAGASRA